MILLKTFVGTCCHSKTKLLYGRKLVQKNAMVQGMLLWHVFMKMYLILYIMGTRFLITGISIICICICLLHKFLQVSLILISKHYLCVCFSRKNGSPPPLCGRGYDVESPYYRELQSCIGGTHSSRWISIEERATWPSRDHLNKNELAIYGNCYILHHLFIDLSIERLHCII